MQIDIKSKGKGLIPRSPDPRAIKYSSLFGEFLVDWNKGFDLRDFLRFKVENQGSSASCVPQSISKYAEVLDKFETGETPDLSARDMYSRIYQPGGGAYVHWGMSLWVNRGIPMEGLVPSYERNLPPSEQFMRIRSESPSVESNAFVRRIRAYAALSSNIDEYAHAIENSKGIVFGVAGTNDGWQTAFPRPPKEGEEVWYHLLMGIGFKKIDGKKHIIALNSWGEEWGDKGFCYVSEDYFSGIQIFGGQTATDIPNLPESIKMLDLVMLKGGRDQWIVSAGFRYRLPDIETKNWYRDKLKVILDEPRIVMQEEFDRLIDGGRIPSWLLDYKLSGFYSDLKDAMEPDVG